MGGAYARLAQWLERKLTNNESYHRTKGKHNEKRKERAIAFRCFIVIGACVIGITGIVYHMFDPVC